MTHPTIIITGANLRAARYELAASMLTGIALTAFVVGVAAHVGVLG